MRQVLLSAFAAHPDPGDAHVRPGTTARDVASRAANEPLVDARTHHQVVPMTTHQPRRRTVLRRGLHGSGEEPQDVAAAPTHQDHPAALVLLPALEQPGLEAV